MFYLMVIILAVIIGLLRGGELEKLSHISIEGIWMFALALLLRGLIWIFEMINLSAFQGLSPYLILVSYLLLIIVSIRNIKLPGFRYITLGILLNSFVIFLNGGKMPVLVNKQMAQHVSTIKVLGQEQNSIHSFMHDRTLFAFLGDVLSMPKPFPDNSILSAGDILIFVGLFILIQKTLMKEDLLPQEKTTAI